MIKNQYLKKDGTVGVTIYEGENREEWDFMTENPIGDGTYFTDIPKELIAQRIKEYEKRFPIKVIQLPNSCEELPPINIEKLKKMALKKIETMKKERAKNG
ncbi:MAG: hypothetical protein KBT47_09175 [Armatimonadetes bacterium]|nr:hypothetical protein [Candidatus Hippobium faecium]